MTIAIGSDHAGYDLKEKVIDFLKSRDIEVVDFGPYNRESVDYPDYGHPVADAVETNKAKFGIVICGSGNGINMTVNKHQGIRSGLCWNTEIAELTRLHNNANMLAIPGRYVNDEQGLSIVDVFLNTEFEGGRHQRRIDKINKC